MMRRRTREWGQWLVAAVGCAVLTGCLGGRSTLTPNNPLSDAARDVRNASAPPPGYPRELDKAPAEPYVVEPGDVLLVQPSSLDSPVRLPGDQPVLPDGTIQLGKYGRLPVAGKTVDQIEVDVNALVRAKEEEKNVALGPILVRLVTRDSKVFYVLGEVNAPGAFPLRGRETVLDAIVIAGGLNTNASRKNILLSRPTAPDSCRMVLPVNYDAIVQLGDTTTNYQIRAGDRVYVSSRTFHEDLAAIFRLSRGKEPHCATPCFPAGGPVVGGPVGGPVIGGPVIGGAVVGPVAKGAPKAPPAGLPERVIEVRPGAGAIAAPPAPAATLPTPAPREEASAAEIGAPQGQAEGPVRWVGSEPGALPPPPPPGATGR